jgi:hypothetical protein
MALTRDVEIPRYVDQTLRSYEVAEGVTIFKGAFVGLDGDGLARPLVAGDQCVGIAYKKADNQIPARQASVRVLTEGDFSFPMHFSIPMDTGPNLKVGRTIYALDDGTIFWAYPQCPKVSVVGVCVGVVNVDDIILRLDPYRHAN